MSDTPRSDARCAFFEGGVPLLNVQFVVPYTVAQELERENATLRELLGRFAEFHRDATGYCEWCGARDFGEDHASDCIYPEVKAALANSTPTKDIETKKGP